MPGLIMCIILRCLSVHVSPEAGGMKLPEAKKKEAAADIGKGWDNEEWEVSETVCWWHKDSDTLQFDHAVWLAYSFHCFMH